MMLYYACDLSYNLSLRGNAKSPLGSIHLSLSQRLVSMASTARYRQHDKESPQARLWPGHRLWRPPIVIVLGEEQRHMATFHARHTSRSCVAWSQTGRMAEPPAI